MRIIATVAVGADEFVFGEALATNPEMRIRLERLVPLGSAFVPYVWVTAGSVAEIERALRTEVDIGSFTVVDQVDDETLVRVEWEDDVDGLFDPITPSDATVLDAIGRADGWTVQLRFVDHDALTAFHRRCADRGVPLDLRSVHTSGTSDEADVGLGITDTQRETLRFALERGYFEVPRRISLTELAAQTGVSDTALSQRIRRGISTLLAQTLPDVEDASPADR